MKNNKFKMVYITLLTLSALIFATTIQFNTAFKNMRFELILYNLLNMKEINVGINSFQEQIKEVLIAFGIITILFTIPPCITININKSIFIKPLKRKINIFPISLKFYSIILFIISIVSILTSLNFWSFLTNNIKTSNFYEKYYVEYKKENIIFPENKPNLITIFVESMETSVFSKENGGTTKDSYMPNMENLTKEYINFSNTNNIGGFHQINGTDWTASALVGETAGIPFYFQTTNNQNLFLEGATSIGDILYDNGYQNYFLMGSDSAFGDRFDYFNEHGNYQIFDYYSAINNNLIPSDYFVWWGYEDKKLYTYAKAQLKEISKNKEQPFNFSMLTVDTHSYEGYVDESCPKKFEDNYANSYYCTDIMLYDFINWIQSQDFYENTVIVIIGDHLTMRNDFFKTNKDYERTIYNLFINSKTNPYNTNNRIFSTFDIYPTTLAALGITIKDNRLALGTNLFSEEKTLMEELGINNFKKEIAPISKYYNEKILKK